MEKVRVKELVEFSRRKLDKRKVSFAKRLKSRKPKEDSSSGGDYWISCLSVIANTFKSENDELLNEKIEILTDKILSTDDKRNGVRYQRNIDVLHNFLEFDFQELKPGVELNYLKKLKTMSILDIHGIPLFVKPDHVFTFSTDGHDEVGAVWFIAQKDGFEKKELGMFTDVLYRYLKKHYSKKYFINKSYCIAVDVNTAQMVSYDNLKNGHVSLFLDNIISELKSLE